MTIGGGTNEGGKVTIHIDAGLKDLVPGFLENRQHDVATILKALEQGDYETIRIRGHSLKGIGGGYGFEAITAIGAALEQAGKAKKPDEVQRWVGDLKGYLDRVQIVYE